jgi:cytochrome d ubiquinol oxidase subunit I
LLANGWMQRPVGFVLRNGRAEMVDFFAVATNPYGWAKFLHTCSACYLLSAGFVMAVCAYHLLKKQQEEFFKRSFRMAASFGVWTALLTLGSGGISAIMAAKYQPAKLAAMEGVWQTRRAAPYYLIAWPDPEHERNFVQALGVPRGLSLLAYHDGNAEVRGLRDFPKELRPPVLPTFISFKAMVLLGMLLLALTLVAWLLSRRDQLQRYPIVLRLLLYTLPLPYLAIQLGWIVAEVGRQPWIVYGVLKTSDAVSKSLTTRQVAASLAGFTVFYGVLIIIDAYLLFKNARRVPVPAQEV